MADMAAMNNRVRQLSGDILVLRASGTWYEHGKPIFHADEITWTMVIVTMRNGVSRAVSRFRVHMWTLNGQRVNVSGFRLGVFGVLRRRV